MSRRGSPRGPCGETTQTMTTQTMTQTMASSGMDVFQLTNYSNYRRSPTWVMGSRPNTVERPREQKPDAGSYSPDIKITSKYPTFGTCKISSSERWKKDKPCDVPGPGFYVIRMDKDRGKAGFGFGTDKRLRERKVAQAPSYVGRPNLTRQGSGVFDNRGCPLGAKWKTDGGPKKEGPSPGAYNMTDPELTLFHKTPSISFGRSKRPEINSMNKVDPPFYDLPSTMGTASRSICKSERWRKRRPSTSGEIGFKSVRIQSSFGYM